MAQPTVGRRQQWFIDKGVDGLRDEPRPGRETAICAFIDVSNTAGQPYVWTATADEILASIARFESSQDDNPGEI